MLGYSMGVLVLTIAGAVASEGFCRAFWMVVGLGPMVQEGSHVAVLATLLVVVREMGGRGDHDD